MCRTLQYKIKDLINQGKLEVDNHVTLSNQNLGIYQNPLPQHQENNVSLHSLEHQKYLVGVMTIPPLYGW